MGRQIFDQAAQPPTKPKEILKIINIGKNKTVAKIFGKIKKDAELTPIISSASICSVTLIDPISEAIF